MSTSTEFVTKCDLCSSIPLWFGHRIGDKKNHGGKLGPGCGSDDLVGQQGIAWTGRAKDIAGDPGGGYFL